MASFLVVFASAASLGSGMAPAVWAPEQAPGVGQQRLVIQVAQASVRSFNIPKQSLRNALLVFGHQTGMQISSDPASLAGLQAPAIEGDFTPRQALKQLLKGTKLTPKFIGQRAVVVSQPNPVYAQASTGTTLDAITVVGDDDGDSDGEASGSGFQGTPDWVYNEASSVSVISREAVQNSGVRDTRDLLSGVSGVYSGEGNGSFPTVSPNIRGLQDSGRVVISIDGARQNAQRGYGFGSGGYQSNAGQAFVDSAFIRTIEIDKDPDASSGNAGSLGGSVIFRTIGADDLIKAGQNQGVEINVTRGTNEYNFQGSILGAMRLTDTPFSITAGLSRLKMGEYAIGKNGDESTALKHFKAREAFSSLLKLDGDFGDVQTTLSWMHQENDFEYGSGGPAGNFENVENVNVDSVIADLSWNPNNNLINLNTKLWLNNSATDELREARLSVSPDTYIDMRTLSFGGVLENTSEIDTQAGAVSLNYGMEAFRDIVTSSATSSTIEQNPLWANRYTAFSPPGNRDVASAFASADWEAQDWLTLSGGLRYDWSRLHGTPIYYDRENTVTNTSRLALAVTTYGVWAQVNDPTRYNVHLDRCNNHPVPAIRAASCNRLAAAGEGVGGVWYVAGVTIPGVIELVTTYPSHALDIDRSDGEWLPALRAEFKPFDWFKPYISYSQSFRPPTVLEAFFTGGLPGDGAVGTNFAPNTSLRPERARTYEIGTNVSVDGTFTDDDRLRFKAAAFQREIDDYIVLGTILADEVADNTYLSFVNLDGPTTMRGLELEGNYDAGLFWIGGSATWLETEWPQSTQIFSNGTRTTTGAIFATAGNVPPRYKLTIDGGIRLMEEKLQIGARLNRVLPTLSRFLDKEGNLTETTEPYTKIDLYGSYNVTDIATLRMAVNNIRDVNYIPASGTYNAPGRTFTMSFNAKF